MTKDVTKCPAHAMPHGPCHAHVTRIYIKIHNIYNQVYSYYWVPKILIVWNLGTGTSDISGYDE